MLGSLMSPITLLTLRVVIPAIIEQLHMAAKLDLTESSPGIDDQSLQFLQKNSRQEPVGIAMITILVWRTNGLMGVHYSSFSQLASNGKGQSSPIGIHEPLIPFPK